MMSEGNPTLQSLGTELGRVIERQFDHFCRATLHGPNVTIEPSHLRIITGEPHPFGNFLVVDNDADPDDARLEIGPLLAIDAPSAIVCVGDPSDELVMVCGEAGFALAEAMPAMAVDLEDLARPTIPEGYELREVEATDEDEWCEALGIGYEIPRAVADHFWRPRASGAHSGNATRYFAVLFDGAIVATSTMFVEDGIVGVYCVATKPDHRRKGLGACITAEPLHRLREEGHRIGVLQSSLMGEPVYRKLGFEKHGVMPVFVRIPGAHG